MTDGDCLDLLAQELGFVLKRSRGKLWSCCSGERMFSVSYQQDLAKALFIRCLVTEKVLQVPCNGQPSLLSRMCIKGGSVANTRLSSHAKMLLVPVNFFLCRVDYALEENFLTEQTWILADYCIFHTERSWQAYWLSLVGMICPLMQEHFLFWPLQKCKVLHCSWLRVLRCSTEFSKVPPGFE